VLKKLRPERRRSRLSAALSIGVFWFYSVFGVRAALAESTSGGGGISKKHRAHHKHTKRSHGARKPSASQERDPQGFAATVEARVSGGYQSGRKTRRFDSAVVKAEGKLELGYRFSSFELLVPFEVAHTEPLALSLRETKGSLGAELAWRPSREFRPSVGVSLLGALRPNWPDPYQPLASGALASTDRHSYLERRAEVALTSIPFKRQRAKLGYLFSVREYVQDPHFDAIFRPNHLTPGNYWEHRVSPSWRSFFGALSVGVSAELYYRKYLYEFARDRWTGKTHAGPGGPPPNPLMTFLGVTPELSVKYEILSGLDLRPRFAVTFNHDPFQGYESFAELHPELDLTWDVTPRFRTDLGIEAYFRSYGDEGYRRGVGHPPLDIGDTRTDRRWVASTGISYLVASGTRVGIDVRAEDRVTNFPDYEPGQFPSGQAYDIDWDYRNLGEYVWLEYRPGAQEER
jgi:hypothetical protein